MTPTNTEALAARLESGWCPIESPTDMERAAAELRRLSAENVAAVSSFLSADEERIRLRAERDALVADAERWRWLRERYPTLTREMPAKALGLDLRRLYVNTREKFDAAIDAARKDHP